MHRPRALSVRRAAPRAVSRGLFIIALALSGTACVNANIEEYRQGSSSVGAGDRIVVLGRRHSNGYETEPDFVECVGNSLQRSDLGVNVIPEDQFVDDLFPWFEPRTAPRRVGDLPELFDNPLVLQRVREQNLRYVVWLDGSTNTTDSSGSMACTASITGASCFGFMTWDKESNYEASIWDLESFDSVGRIASDASGTSYMPAVFVPVPIIARVQASACDGMADQLSSFFVAG